MSGLDAAMRSGSESSTVSVPGGVDTEIILSHGYTGLPDDWLSSNTRMERDDRVRLSHFAESHETSFCVTVRGGQIVCVESAPSNLRLTTNPIVLRTGMQVQLRRSPGSDRVDLLRMP